MIFDMTGAWPTITSMRCLAVIMPSFLLKRLNAMRRGKSRISPPSTHFPFLYMILRISPAALTQVLQAAQAAYSACEILVDEQTLIVQRYVIKPLTCDREYQPVQYENGIKILDKFADFDSERGSVRIVTGWEVADDAQLQQYNVSIQLITADWQNVSQAGDRHLYDEILKWYSVDMPTAGLPPGDYRAVVVLYDRFSNAKVSGTDLRSGETGAILPVFAFTITENLSEESQ